MVRLKKVLRVSAAPLVLSLAVLAVGCTHETWTDGLSPQEWRAQHAVGGEAAADAITANEAAADWAAGPATSEAAAPGEWTGGRFGNNWRPADLTVLPPTPTDYTPGKTEWGDWDFTGIWPIDNLPSTSILLQRMDGYKDRVWITEEEHAKRIENAGRSDGAFSNEGQGLNVGGTEGLVDWVTNSPYSWRTSMIVSPKDGKLPPLTPDAQIKQDTGRSGWQLKQTFDWVDDFDSWDRCVSRGFPASMFPFRYNHGIRIFQSPGYVTIVLEMLGNRVVKLYPNAAAARAAKWDGDVEAWMGNSRGWWEGKTLVIETTNIKSGDSLTRDVSKRAAAPLNIATQYSLPFNTAPTSTKAKSLEKLTMQGPDAILYEITYDDPEVFTAPWTAQLEWTRKSDYEFFEYACHEGNVQVRNYITADRAKRAGIARGEIDPNEPDGNAIWSRQFDFDRVAPGAPPPPNFGPPPPPREEEEEGE
jgi:hypothetical protein